MKRIGFISDDLGVKDPISQVMSEFCARSEFAVEPLNRLDPALPIINKVRSLIDICDVIVFYVAHGSPDIYYEIGLAHGAKKNVVILAESPSLVPFDLSQEKCIYIDSGDFDRVKYEIYYAIFRTSLAPKYMGGLSQSDNGFFDEYFQQPPIAYAFRDLYALPSLQRGKALEDWFYSLATQITQWNVIRADDGSQPDSFDFMLWNNADDPEFKILGNPIPVEIKSLNSLNSEQIERLARRLRKQGLRSVLLLTSARNRLNWTRLSQQLKHENGATIVALDRDDLIDVRSPNDLYFAIKKELLAVVHGGE